MNNSKVHLNKTGNKIFAQNFIKYLRQWGFQNCLYEKSKSKPIELNNNDKQDDTENININEIIDLEQIIQVFSKHPENPKIGYLNINHLRNKIVDLRPIVLDLDFTILTIAETKLDDSFPNDQFYIEGYYNPGEFRKDRLKNGGGGILTYVKRVPLAKDWEI